MQITCTICTSLFVIADTIVGVSCGHVFHHHCLMQWLERSKSCPQCRAKTSDKNTCRIFFNIHNGPSEDTNTLQNKIDSLEFKLLLKDTELKKCHEEMASHKQKVDGLKGEIKRLKTNVKASEANNTILKEQFSVLKKRNDDLEPTLRECEKLRKELQAMKNVEIVLKGTSEEVDDMLNDYEVFDSSTKSLLTFTSVLKKEMQATTAKKKELSFKLHESEKKVLALTSQIRHLHEDLTVLKEKNKYLSMEVTHASDERTKLLEKINALEKAVISPTASHPSTSALKRLLAESPAPSSLKRGCTNTPEKLFPTTPESAPAPDADESSYLSIKASSVGITPLRPIQFKNMQSHSFGILRKPQINTLKGSSTKSNEEYDGLGGHSKPDEFPRPTLSIRIRKDKNRLSKIKLKDASNSLKMDLFLKK